jgi:hypothetical protein
MKPYLMFPSHLLRPGIEIPITLVLLSRLGFFLQTTLCHLLFALELAGIGACLHKLLLPLLLQTLFIELRDACVGPSGFGGSSGTYLIVWDID